MMTVKVSVVITFYDAEENLRQCLDSIIGQTLKEIEIICVDTADTEALYSILKEYAVKDERIQILRNNNGKAGLIWETGMEAASGEYILFIDSAEITEPDALEKMYVQAKKENADICVCDAKPYMDDSTEPVKSQNCVNISMLPGQETFSHKDISEYIFQFTLPVLWNKLFRREFIYNDIGVGRAEENENLYFVFLMLCCAERITVKKEQLLYYCNDNQAKEKFSILDSLKELRKELIQRKKYVEVAKSFVNYSLDICLHYLDSADELEVFIQRYQDVKLALYELGVVGQAGSIFYYESNFKKMLQLYETSPEALWENNKKTVNKRIPSKLVDYINWKPNHEEMFGEYPKISVIVPVYNVQKYLEEALDSLIEQTLKEIEIICIDDGSTDDSPYILERYAKSDTRIRVFTKENGGLSSARNYGIDRASGKYIYFMDSDDVLERKTLEICYDELEKNDLDLVMFTAESFNGSVDNVLNPLNDFYTRYSEYEGIVSGKEFFTKAVFAMEFKPSACMYVTRREILRKNSLRFYEGIIHEDNLFTIECLALADRVKYINSNFYKRRVRENSIMTSSKVFFRAYSLFVVIRELEKFIQERNLNKDYDFYNAVWEQMLRIRNVASGLLTDIGQKEAKNETQKYWDGKAFYFYVCESAFYKRQIIEKSRQLNNNKSQKIKLGYDIGRAQERSENLKQENKGLRQETSELKTQVSEARQKASELKMQISELGQEISGIKQENSRLKQIEKKYNGIVQSYPYKILQMILFVPRKIKRTLINKR